MLPSDADTGVGGQGPSANSCNPKKHRRLDPKHPDEVSAWHQENVNLLSQAKVWLR